MPDTNWSKLNKLQLGRYAEYYAKMEFTSYGFEVYTSEVDDHGIDFIAKGKTENFMNCRSKQYANPTMCICKKTSGISQTRAYT